MQTIALTLAKTGWFGGNPQNVYEAPVDVVFEAYHYEIFTRDYENTYTELNSQHKGK